MFDAAVEAFVAGKFKKPVDLFFAMEELEMISNVKNCNNLLLSLRERRQYQAMEELLEHMNQRSIPADEVTYMIMIQTYGALMDLRKAILYFDRLKATQAATLTAHSYRSIITTCINCLNFERAKVYLDEMLNAGIKPDAIAFKSVFARLVKLKEYATQAAELCVAILEEMDRRSVQPTRAVCGMAVRICAVAHRDRPLASLYQTMKDRGMEIERRTYHNLLFGLGKNKNNWNLSIRIYEDMKKSGTTLILYTYHLLLRGSMHARDEKRSLMLIDEMRSYGIEPDLVAYNSVIQSFVKGFTGAEQTSAWDKIEDLLQEMESRDVHLDLTSYNTLLNVCINNGDRNRANKYFTKMKAAGVPRDARTFAKLIAVEAQQDDPEEAGVDQISALVEQMEEEGLRLDCPACCDAMRGFVKGKSIAKAKAFIKVMDRSGITYDKLLLQRLLEFWISIDEKKMAYSTLEEVLRQKALRPIVAHTIFLQTFVRSADVSSAVELLQKMKDDDLQFSKATYRILEQLKECEVTEENQNKIDSILGPDSPIQF